MAEAAQAKAEYHQGSNSTVSSSSPELTSIPVDGQWSPADGVAAQPWDLDPAEITVCKRPDGSDWILGIGSFGQVDLLLLYMYIKGSARFCAADKDSGMLKQQLARVLTRCFCDVAMTLMIGMSRSASMPVFQSVPVCVVLRAAKACMQHIHGHLPPLGAIQCLT